MAAFSLQLFLAPLISVCSLAVLWQGQPRHLPCFLSQQQISNACEETAASAALGQDLALQDEWMPSRPALGLIYTVKEGFLNVFSLQPGTGFFSFVLETFGLMLRCRSLSVEKCVIEPGHPMNTIL